MQVESLSHFTMPKFLLLLKDHYYKPYAINFKLKKSTDYKRATKQLFLS